MFLIVISPRCIFWLLAVGVFLIAVLAALALIAQGLDALSVMFR